MHLNHSGRIALMTALVAVMIFFQFGSGIVDSDPIPNETLNTPLATTDESIDVSKNESFTLKYDFTASNTYPYIGAYAFELRFDPAVLEFVKATDLTTGNPLVPYEREPGVIGFSSDGYTGAKTESGIFELTLKSNTVTESTTVRVLLDDVVVMEGEGSYAVLMGCLSTEEHFDTVVNVKTENIPDEEKDEDEKKDESSGTATTSTIVSNDIKKTADNMFAVQTSIVNSPGFGYFEMTLRYDPTRCTITEKDVTRGSLISDGNTFGVKVDDGTVHITWLTPNGKNSNGDGTIVTINVKSIDGTIPTIEKEKLKFLRYTEPLTGETEEVAVTFENNVIDNGKDDGKDGDGGQASEPSQTETSGFNYFYIGIPIVVVGIIIALMARRD